MAKAAFAVGAAAAASSLAPGMAWAAPLGKPKSIPTSANGWPIEKETNYASTVWTRPVSGTGLQVDIRIGDVEAVLVHVIRRFHYEIEEIPREDLAGWRAIGSLHKESPESNLASGTAVRIRPGADAKGSFFPLQEQRLRDILADCEGIVRWGGDDTKADESLFSIDVGPDDDRLRQLADRIRGWEATPGEGAGTAH